MTPDGGRHGKKQGHGEQSPRPFLLSPSREGRHAGCGVPPERRQKRPHHHAMEIRIEDYLDHDGIREAILESIRLNAGKALINEHYNDSAAELDRLVGNAAIRGIESAIDAQFGCDFERLVRQRVLEELQKGDFANDYRIFRKKDARDRESVAQRILDDTVRENAGLIREKVREAIENFDYGKAIAGEISDIFGRLADIFYNQSKRN